MNIFEGLIVFVVIMVILRSALNRAFRKYNKISNKKGLTGVDVAINMLRNNKISGVKIGIVEGHLTDYYDTSDNTIYLSETVYHSHSLSAIAVAAHEVGHAIQHNKGNKLFWFHNNLSYVVNIGSNFTRFFIYIGFIFGLDELLGVGLILLFTTFTYQVISLPLEIEASRLGYDEIKNNAYTSDGELKYVQKVLRSAFLTYVYIVIYTPINTLRLFPK